MGFMEATITSPPKDAIETSSNGDLSRREILIEQIYLYKDIIRQQDRQIQQLEHIVQKQAQQICELKQIIQELDHQNRQLRQVIQENEQLIGEKNQVIQLPKQLAQKQDHLIHKQDQLILRQEKQIIEWWNSMEPYLDLEKKRYHELQTYDSIYQTNSVDGGEGESEQLYLISTITGGIIPFL